MQIYVSSSCRRYTNVDIKEMKYEPKIAKKELVHGAYYIGTCRNASIARWHEIDQVFYHWRTKFGSKFIETICHPDDDQVYDVFVAEDIYCPTDNEIIPFENETTQS